MRRSVLVTLLVCVLGLPLVACAQTEIFPGRPTLPSLISTFSVKEYGAAGDGVTDDRLAIARAVAAVIAAGGGQLYFPAGTYVTTSSLPLLSITYTGPENIVVTGAGISATTLKQLGTGDVIRVDGTAGVEIYGPVLREFTVHGNGTANNGITTVHAKDMLIERVNIWACTGHGIDVTGYATLNGIIRQVRIGTNTSPAATKAGISINIGNQWRIEYSYLNGGGNPDNGGNGYTTGIDAQGVAGLVLLGNIYDGLKYGVQANGQVTAIQEYVDLTSQDPVKLTNGYYPKANNQFNIIGALNSAVLGNVAGKLVKLDGNVSRKYLTVIGANDGSHSGVIAGMPRWSVLTPAAITATQHNYEPLDATFSDGRYHGVWNISANAATYFITGIAGGEDGDVRVLHNIGANAITFRYDNGGSLAANRILSNTSGNDWPLQAGDSMTLVYDGSVSRWRVVSLFSTSPQPNVQETLTPAQITADQNDYAPTGMAGTHFWRLSSDASRSITGISAGSVSFSQTYVVDGYRLTLVNVGAQNIVLVNQATSTAGNRIITGTGANLTLTPDQSATLIYDGTTSRWRVIGRNF